MKGIIKSWLNRFKSTGAELEKFPPQVWERLNSGPDDDNMIVARALPSTNRFSRWIIIYQRKTNDIRDQYFKLRYTIHEFELPNTTDNIDTSEKINKKTWYVRKEDEIYELLYRIGIQPGNFSIPSTSNYPFARL